MRAGPGAPGSGFIGRRARWPGDLDWLGGLGGQEQDSQEGTRRGDTCGDEAADGQAAQERVSGGVLQRLPEARMAKGRDLAGGHVRRADGLVCDRRDPAGHAGWQGGGQP